MTFLRFAAVAAGAAAVGGFFVACEAGTGDVLPTIDSGTRVDTGAPPVSTGDDESGSPGTDAGGGTGFTGFSGDGGPCRPSFASGVNVAWVNFAQDIPNPNLGLFDLLFQNVYGSGGRVARWWFHVNGTKTPGYDPSGFAVPISQSQIDDVKSIIDTARYEGMMVTISLWSFDMLKGSVPPPILANNMNLLTDDLHRQAYITNVLTPLATALAGYPGLYAWETFNEPEGMASDGVGWGPFTMTRTADGGTSGAAVPMTMIQRTVSLFASAIHAADPSALVTNGTWEFQAVSNVSGMNNYYSDDNLLAAGGGAPGGTLDFYEVHYYAANGVKYSPFANPATHWGLDKPVVAGEFYALPQDNVTDAGDLYTTLYDGGYAGAWAWQYESSDGNNRSNGGQPTKWPAMQAPIQNLYAAAPDAVGCP